MKIDDKLQLLKKINSEQQWKVYEEDNSLPFVDGFMKGELQSTSTSPRRQKRSLTNFFCSSTSCPAFHEGATARNKRSVST